MAMTDWGLVFLGGALLPIVGLGTSAHGQTWADIQEDVNYFQSSPGIVTSLLQNEDVTVEVVSYPKGVFNQAALNYPGTLSPLALQPDFSSPIVDAFGFETFVSTSGKLLTPAEVSAEFPFGTYKFSLSNNTTSAKGSVTLNYSSTAFSLNIPQLSSASFNALQNLNTSQQSLTVSFNTISPSPLAAMSNEGFSIYTATSEILACGTGTSCTFSPSALQPGTTYRWKIAFNDFTYPEASDYVETSVETDGFFTTAGASTILPQVTKSGGRTAYDFDFLVQQGATYKLDPTAALGYIYKIGAGDPNFASVSLPDIGNPGPYSLYLWNGTAFVFDTTLAADTVFDFGSGGVSEFEVLGIDPSLELDPTNPTSFVTNLTFTGAGTFDGTMTPITTNAPEPATWAMLIAGFTSLGLVARRRAGKAASAA